MRAWEELGNEDWKELGNEDWKELLQRLWNGSVVVSALTWVKISRLVHCAKKISLPQKKEVKHSV